MVERLIVRILIVTVLCAALLAFAFVPIPINENGSPDLPAPALGQLALYRLEIALMSFYGTLLLITPAVSGLVRGRLPIEISTRGAKFAAEADQIAGREEAAIRKLEWTTERLEQRLTDTRIEFERLSQVVRRDSTQPEVHSKR